ncbi:MAG: hypothetical protein AAF497_17300, partial [Planctomycetota bacterium]
NNLREKSGDYEGALAALRKERERIESLGRTDQGEVIEAFGKQIARIEELAEETKATRETD